MAYTLLHGDDPSIETIQGVFIKIRRALGVNGFGINEVRAPAGATGREHDEVEVGHEEVYFAVSGSGTFTIDGEVVPFAAGDYLRVDAGSTRQAAAGPEGLRYVVVGAKPKPEYDGRPTL